MRHLFSVAALFAVATPAFAEFIPPNAVPEPGSLALLAIGAVGAMVALRKKK